MSLEIAGVGPQSVSFIPKQSSPELAEQGASAPVDRADIPGFSETPSGVKH